jgi:hypothetical protein
MSSRSLAIAAVVAGGALAACHTPGGGIMPFTGGSHTFYSTETRPVTVELVDLRNKQVVFRMDIPPGRQLSLDFRAGEGDDPVYTPDLMRYHVWEVGTTTGRLRNSLTVPAAWARRLDVSYRPGVEYMTAPPDRELRTDEMEDRPDWWTPQGGEMPVDNRGGSGNYDG